MPRKGQPSDYIPAPEVPPELERRFQLVIGSLAGVYKVAQAARELGISRNRFQTIMHRGAAAMLYAIQPHPAGRPPKPERELELEQRVAELEQENAELSRQVATTTRLFDVAASMLKSRAPRARSRTTAPSPTKTTGGADDDEPRRALAEVDAMRTAGIPVVLAAAAVGCSSETARRYARRRRRGEVLRRRRGPRLGPTPAKPDARDKVAAIVKETHGLVGADSLRHAVAGVSRRACSLIKRETLTEVERERRAAAQHVAVAAPGVIRGFDAMHFSLADGVSYALVAADAAVPYRTAFDVVLAYDGDAVARAVEEDFRLNGAPLVWRRDRALCHAVDDVDEVLRKYGVLVLAGPPHYPRFYGQLERQNREHRAWMTVEAPRNRDELAAAGPRMLRALNGAWRRRTLGWRTALAVWEDRPVLDVDRDALRLEVDDRRQRLERGGVAADVASRLAVEITLKKRDLIRRETGTWC